MLSEHSYQFQGAVVAVRSADEGLAAAVGYRLQDHRLPTMPAPDVRLDFLVRPERSGRAGETVSERRAVYDTPIGPIYYRAADDALEATLGCVRLEARVGDGAAKISAARYEPADRYLAAHPLTMIVLCEAVKRRGRYNLHAGCVAKGSRCALIAGPSGSGKSTLVLGLAQRGLDFVSDDMVFLSVNRAGVEVHGFADAIGITRDTAARFDELSDLAGIEPPRGFRKHLIRIDERFGVRTREACEPAFLIFPELVPGEESGLALLDPGEAWLRLLPDVLLTDPAATDAHTSAIAALTEHVTCYRLLSGSDVGRSAELIERLFDAT